MASKVLNLLLIVAAMTGCADNLTPPPDRAGYVPGPFEDVACRPNLDGVIQHHELGAVFGVPLSYLINPAGIERAVDITGVVTAEGQRVWDWGHDFADDQVLELAAGPLLGKWYAESFPSGQVVIPIEAGGRIQGVYRQDETGLYLLGMASREEAPAEGQTLIVYAEPAALLRFPLEVGRKWTAVGKSSQAMFRGLPYAGTDTYTVSVSASGELVLPDLVITQAMRVETQLVIIPAVGIETSVRQVSFLFECFGEVARATSRNNEANPEFTTAAEVRRLGLF